MDSAIPGWIKLNVDATVRTTFMTTAAVARDDTGASLGLFIEKINYANAAFGEALAILSAIKLVEYINRQDLSLNQIRR
ncbi:hypothetical protein PanWU01x14_195250 [Parasponia andersonii]|uniref:RNase H type-1 domain-containing protein n=1 Tax=Parasponia andersonii TaxID=3476 RepID=A0A2P5C0B0_PARAD|nr:hypothetical protein PanWU01x14_195250 [Parasponia andersonii]